MQNANSIYAKTCQKELYIAAKPSITIIIEFAEGYVIPFPISLGKYTSYTELKIPNLYKEMERNLFPNNFTLC